MKLIFILLVVYLAYYVFKSIAMPRTGPVNSAGRSYREAHSNRRHPEDTFTRASGTQEKQQVQSDPGEEMVQDPVCSSYVPLSVAVKKGTGSKTVYFCSKECRDKYSG